MERRPITWENIEQEFTRYNYAIRLENYKEKLRTLESDVQKFKEFVEYVDAQEFSCADIWQIKSSLRTALTHLSK